MSRQNFQPNPKKAIRNIATGKITVIINSPKHHQSFFPKSEDGY